MNRLRAVDLRAWSLYLGLTVPFAILAHLVIDVADAGFSWAVLLRPAHATLVVLLLAAASAAAFGLGYGLPDAERRRRLALVRAALRVERHPLLGIAVATVVQAMIVFATVSLDETLVRPERLALTLLAGILAVVAGSLAIRVAERHVLDLALARPRRRRARAAHRSRAVRALRAAATYALFRPNRAPPLLTQAI